jgi:hypothetical protein
VSCQTVAQEFLLKSDSFFVTQEFLSYMLRVRRGGTTAAAGALQRDGLIQPGVWPPVRHGSRLPAHLLIGRQNQRVEVINTNPPAESM